MRSDAWDRLRQQVFARDGYQCQDCGEIATNVHHLTYDRFKNEALADLLSLCTTCHNKRHGR